MLELISIVVPIYNAQKSISSCIESILSQTYKNIEVILVDDGSTDNSFEYCCKYSNIDKRIKLFRKPNGGVSSARNYGLEKSNGEYVAFVDPDDTINSKMYQTLYESLLKYDTDISVSGYNVIRGDITNQNYLECETDVVSGKELLLNIYKYKTMGVLWNKLFKKKCFKFKFDETVHLCEDVIFLTNLCLNDISVSIVKECLYNYMITEESLSYGNFNDRKYSIVTAMMSIEKSTRNTSLYVSSSFFVVTSLVYAYTNTINSDKITHKKQKKSNIKKFFKYLLKSKKIQAKLKMRIICVVLFPRLYLRYRNHKKIK